MKKIFVTGATGKIGSHLVPTLLDQGYKVTALVRDKSRLSLEHKNLKSIEADLLEVSKYQKILSECDFVFHLAAYQNISDSEIDNFVRVNVEGTRSILKAALNSKIKRFFYISTVMVFKPTKNKPIDENSPKKNPGNPNYYVETKLRALRIIDQFKNKIPITVFYPTIVIDPKEKVQGLLWTIIGGGIPGGLMCLIGNKKRIMNYIFMDNLVDAMASVVSMKNLDQDYLLGGENLSVEEYLRQALAIKGKFLIPIRIPIIVLKAISLLKIPQLGLINFVAHNPPENIYVNPQKAINDLGLKISRLQDLQGSAW